MNIFGKNLSVRVCTHFNLRIHRNDGVHFLLGATRVANWKGRAAVIDYCVKVADNVVEGKKKAFEGQEPSLDAERKFRSGIFGDEVKVRTRYSQ